MTSVLRDGFHAQWTFLVIGFDGPLDATSAQTVSNYTIVGPGGRKIKVGRAIYDQLSNTVTLKPVARLDLHWMYRMTINGTSATGVTSAAGVLLDGADTGTPGSDYITSLTWRNLAGRANQLPTADVVAVVADDAPRVQNTSRHVKAAGPAAAVDRILAELPFARRS